MSSNLTPISFPRDGQAHDAIVEWWYFNGHLKDQAGNRYAFMDCLFKVDIKKVKLPFLKNVPFKEKLGGITYVYFAHSLLSDIGQQKNYKEIQNISMISRDSFSRPLMFVNYIDPMIARGYINHEIVETSAFNFNIKANFFNLNLASRKAPLLEGGEGYIALADRATYYYSLTDLRAQGMLNINGQRLAVEGKAWMDHQWANVAYSRDRWSWFSLQLNNGLDLMCVEYISGNKKECLVSAIDAQGRAEHFKNLILRPGQDVWHSKKTKAEYPMSWTIEIPEKDIKLTVKSTMKDQEMIYNAINYWEGPLDVSGTAADSQVGGVGFMELVGYPSDYNYLLLAGKEMNDKIYKALAARWKKKK